MNTINKKKGGRREVFHRYIICIGIHYAYIYYNSDIFKMLFNTYFYNSNGIYEKVFVTYV